MAKLVCQPSPSQLLADVCALLTKTFRTDGCLAYLVLPAAEQVRLVAAFPAPAGALPTLELPLGFGVTGRVAADGIPALLATDQPRNLVHRELLGLAEGQAVSRLCLPCLSAGQTGGPALAILALHQRESRIFAPAEVAAGLAVANLVGLRLDRDRSSTDAREYRTAWAGLVAATVSAQEAERRRIAADLHDGVTQAVASLAFHLSAAETALAGGGITFAATQVQAARELADLAFREARHAIAGLRSPVLDDLGLAAGLESLARSVPQLAITVEALDLHLPEHVSTALYRLAQESIQNAVKHAAASRVLITLVAIGPSVVLTVSDDGQGFDLSARAAAGPDVSADQTGFGLMGMYERVQLLRGRLVIESAPGAGTTVRAVIPIDS